MVPTQVCILAKLRERRLLRVRGTLVTSTNRISRTNLISRLNHLNHLSLIKANHKIFKIP
jgi:hypothetical protein